MAAIGAAPGPNASDTKTKVDAVFQAYDHSDSPGCALGVFQDGKIVYERGYGMANLELGVANSPQAVFDIASTGKQFTAFSIHLLARDARLSLDDNIRKWVPEIPDYGKTITIRHLLHHTGGLRDYLELMSLQGVRDEDLSTDQDALAILGRQKSPNFAPGEEYLYSNSGYFLLSLIVKRASGKSLRDFAEERIFGPLGMRHTQYNDAHTRIIPNRATGYRKSEGGGFGIDMSDFEQNGDGGVLTTVEDLFRWDQNFYEPKVGDRALLDAMLTPGVLNNGKTIDYSSALVVGTYKGLATVSHGGAWVGYRAQLIRFPQQRLSVTCLCNLGQSNPSSLANQVAEVYLGSLMKKQPPSADEAKAGTVPLAAPLERLSGPYRNPDTGEVLEVAVKEGRLVAEKGSTRYILAAVAANRFSIEGFTPPESSEAEFETVPGAARPRVRVTTRDEDGDVEREVYEPVLAWVPTAAQLSELAGSYASDELESTWLLAVQKGKLVVVHRAISEKPLKPTVADTFTLDGMNLTFKRDAARKVTGFRLDEGRVKGIEFAKRSSD